MDKIEPYGSLFTWDPSVTVESHSCMVQYYVLTLPVMSHIEAIKDVQYSKLLWKD
jgi:hypothetical protein